MDFWFATKFYIFELIIFPLYLSETHLSSMPFSTWYRERPVNELLSWFPRGENQVSWINALSHNGEKGFGVYSQRWIYSEESFLI